MRFYLEKKKKCVYNLIRQRNLGEKGNIILVVVVVVVYNTKTNTNQDNNIVKKKKMNK